MAKRETTMSLKKYRQKRDFKKTTEPKGSTLKSKKTGLLYIIQKHAASHLHYDFRLELNGVLLSWAVPKGPSLDPSVKRLAMHVEDHPLEYGSFQGIIPKGQYGGGTVMLWDKGEWIPEDEDTDAAYHKGDLTFVLKGKKLKGRWKLIRINKNDKTWLLMKLKDKYAKKDYDITVEQPNSVNNGQSLDEIAEDSNKVWSKEGLKTLKKKVKKIKFPEINLPAKSMLSSIHPELATLVDNPPEGNNWIHEIKFDGYRLIVYKKDKNVKIFTRNQNDWTSKFPSIAAEVRKLPIKNLILDGEVVVLDDKQKSNFQLLQNSIKENTAEFIYYIFDLLYFDKYRLTELPLIERKKILQILLEQYGSSILRYSDDIAGSGKVVFSKACELGLEGIISKDINSTYSQTRSKQWLKTKCIKRQEFVIGGFQASERRKYFKSLMLGTFNKEKGFVYNGNVGTGFTQASLKEVHSLLSKHITDSLPFTKIPPGSKTATWVKPVVVCEVEFTEWTQDGTLRHPSFKGIRLDKPAKNIKKEIEMPVEKIKNKSKKTANKFNLTHPDKILYSEGDITKYDIAEYYDQVQDYILPYITNRPLTIVRCPVDYKHCFFQKHIPNKPAKGIYGIMIKEKEGEDEYIYIKDFEGLIQLTQLGALELHPWESTIKKVEHPDMLIFDLDPAVGLPWKKVVEAAFKIKQTLGEQKLKSFVKTTGGKGLHVVVPIKPEHEWDKIKIFSKVLVEYLVENNPDKYTAVMTKSKRVNKIYIDYLRNQRGATSVAAYSTRAREFAPVSTPLSWDELTNNIKDTFFTVKTLPERLKRLKKDPWEEFFKVKQSLKLK